MDSEELKLRTRTFAARVIRMTDSLPKTRAANVVAKQIIRSATSIGANYREACRARSNKDFISKIGIVEGETDETLYWLELIVDVDMVRHELLSDLVKEANEFLAIFVASSRTAKKREG